ncbi:MAG: DUF2279 domain-containing protein [Saprospiraceae bacterium]|nr:DUF2279 domain-containing protein [Saprospiraceae bacterium]
MSGKYFILLLWLITFVEQGYGQQKSFFQPSDTLDRARLKKALVFSGLTYTAFSVGLYHTWYKKYPQSRFHLFNDWGEWRHMDKMGHVYTAYLQGVLCYKGAKWTGMKKNKAILTGAICGTLFQSTIEVMDGFSKEWGFSLSDMGANMAGTSSFVLQQYFWDNQRIMFKVSSSPKSYNNQSILSDDGSTITTLQERADGLFGKSYAERYLKDYNAQTYWASVNIHDFLSKDTRWPEWLNIAVGYGAENMFGGHKNEWTQDDQRFVLPDEKFGRYSQFYLSPDIDLTRIKTKSHFLKTLFSVFNIFKVPAPALEINTRGEVIFHFIKI